MTVGVASSRSALLAVLAVGRVAAEPGDAASSTAVYVVLGVGVLLIVGIGVYVWTRRRAASLGPAASQGNKGAKDFHAHASPTARNNNDSPKVPEIVESSNPDPLVLRPAEAWDDPELLWLTIPDTQLVFTRVLYWGAFGEIWLAQVAYRQVAVKRIFASLANDDVKIALFGTDIKRMASLHHPKIIEFVGVFWDALQRVPCAVAEYVTNGNLSNYLKQRKGELNWRDHKIHLAEDIMDALCYLHSCTPAIVHCDLRPKRILLDNHLRAKLAGFGIGRYHAREEAMCGGIGPIDWTAPEVLMGKKYTEKSDIYAFGTIMTQLDTHEVPYHGLRDEPGRRMSGTTIGAHVIKTNLRPTISSECPDLVRELAVRCMHAIPSERPDAQELLRRIQEIRQQLIQDVVVVSIAENQ